MSRIPLRYLFAGLLLLGGSVLVFTGFGRLREFFPLLSGVGLQWIVLAVGLQLATYACLAMVWRLSLKSGNSRLSFRTLFLISVGKLFADQAVPSGGISGIAFFIRALRRRGIERALCTGVMLVSILSFYGAYFIAAGAAVLQLSLHHELQRWIVVASAMFLVLSAAVPLGILRLQSVGPGRFPRFLRRFPAVAEFIDLYGAAPESMVRNGRLLMQSTFWQLSIFLLDGATLWAMLQAVGHPLGFAPAFACFVMASVTAMLSLLPLGIGSFEAASTALLVMHGFPLEAALAATLLLRGFILWIPLVPGLWLTRREFGGAPHA